MDILKGDYEYSYLDHGIWETGSLGAQGENSALILVKTTTTLKVVNRTGTDVTLTLEGPRTYFLSSPIGTTRHVVRKANYTYRYYACGAWQEGEVEVKKNKEFKLPSCASASAGTVKILVDNDTNGGITINMVGPETYWFNLPTGRSPINVVKGTYEYTVWGCGTSSTGTIRVKRKMWWDFWCY